MVLPSLPPVNSYFEARDRFRELVDSLQWSRESCPIASQGPAGEELTIDTAWSTTLPHRPTLVISSGLHGVEGFFGADMQLALLASIADRAVDLDGVRVILIHALNPYGFAHVRRFDGDNVDPNRNFLLPGQSFSGCPDGYAQLDPLLNPRSPQSGCDWFPLRAAYTVLRQGMPRLKQAVAAGQHDFPHGLFFGGQRPCETQQILQKHLTAWLADSARVVHLDLHTGLGKRGTVKLLIDSPLTPHQQDWLDQHFGPESYEACHSKGVAYQARGGLGPWCLAQAGVADYLFACAEFGTYPPLQVLAGLRAENREHHWSVAGSPSYLRAKERLRRLFYPAGNALSQFSHLVEAALRGLRAA